MLKKYFKKIVSMETADSEQVVWKLLFYATLITLHIFKMYVT